MTRGIEFKSLSPVLNNKNQILCYQDEKAQCHTEQFFTTAQVFNTYDDALQDCLTKIDRALCSAKMSVTQLELLRYSVTEN